MSKNKQTKIVKNKPLPPTKLYDLTALPDKKHEEIVKHANKGLAACMADGKAAGYALVTWHMDGTVGVSYWAARGPIGRSLMSAVVHDALLKRVTETATVEDLEDEGRIFKL
jgi:hypothetical protein